MADYIDRAALIKELSESVEPFNTGSVFRAINRQPAADVAPVRHGRWIEDDYGFNRCSECGYEWDESEYKTPFCPECGANMEVDGGADYEM